MYSVLVLGAALHMPRLSGRVRPVVMEEGGMPAPDAMRLAELKAELDQRGVKWRGVAFERAELEGALAAARATPSRVVEEAREAPDLPNGQESSDAAGSTAYEEAYEEAFARAMGLKVKEIRAELAARGSGWADLFEKEELAARLASLCARSALFSASGALEPGKVGKVSAAELKQEMDDDRTPLLLDVYATWYASAGGWQMGMGIRYSTWRCGPCKMLAPELEKLAARLGDSVRIAKLDSDAEPGVSTELRVQGLPTLVFFRRSVDGGLSECHRVEGMPGGVEKLEELVKAHLQ